MGPTTKVVAAFVAASLLLTPAPLAAEVGGETSCTLVAPAHEAAPEAVSEGAGQLRQTARVAATPKTADDGHKGPAPALGLGLLLAGLATRRHT